MRTTNISRLFMTQPWFGMVSGRVRDGGEDGGEDGRKKKKEGKRITKGGQIRILLYAKNEDCHGGRRQDNLPAKTTGVAPLSDLIRTEEGGVGWQNVNLQSVRKRAFCKVQLAKWCSFLPIPLQHCIFLRTFASGRTRMIHGGLSGHCRQRLKTSYIILL